MLFFILHLEMNHIHGRRRSCSGDEGMGEGWVFDHWGGRPISVLPRQTTPLECLICLSVRSNDVSPITPGREGLGIKYSRLAHTKTTLIRVKNSYQLVIVCSVFFSHLPPPFPFSSYSPTHTHTHTPVSYTHLDVYKRQSL